LSACAALPAAGRGVDSEVEEGAVAQAVSSPASVNAAKRGNGQAVHRNVAGMVPVGERKRHRSENDLARNDFMAGSQ
jgi:hypothetical protein